MDKHTVIIFAQILAVQAEIEGMKAENTQREMMGQSLACGEDFFNIKADELRELSKKLTDL